MVKKGGFEWGLDIKCGLQLFGRQEVKPVDPEGPTRG
jgi:hypothetical protein